MRNATKKQVRLTKIPYRLVERQVGIKDSVYKQKSKAHMRLHTHKNFQHV